MPTIADSFYALADEVAGSPVTRTDHTIMSAIDALNDALAGSDQPAKQSIADAIAVLTGNVAAPKTLTTKNITANGTYPASSDSADGFSSVTVAVPEASYTLTAAEDFAFYASSDTTGTAITSAHPGDYVYFDYSGSETTGPEITLTAGGSVAVPVGSSMFIMPKANVVMALVAVAEQGEQNG